jgi:hypothetical protein
MPQKKAKNKSKKPSAQPQGKKKAASTFLERTKIRTLVVFGIFKKDKTSLLFLVLAPILIWIFALGLPPTYWGIESTIAAGIELIACILYAFFKYKEDLSKSYIAVILFLVGAIPSFVLDIFILAYHHVWALAVLQTAQGFLILSFAYIVALVISFGIWTGLLLLEVFRKKKGLIIVLIALAIASFIYYPLILNAVSAIAGVAGLLTSGGLIAYVFKLWNVKYPKRRDKEHKKVEDQFNNNAIGALKYFIAAVALIWLFQSIVGAHAAFFSQNTINQSKVQPSTSLISNIGSILDEFAVLIVLALMPILGLMLFIIGFIQFYAMFGNIRYLKKNKT